MNNIIMHVTVGAKRQLTIDLPDDLPVGMEVTVTIAAQNQETPLEEARRILAQAGKLADILIDDDEYEDISDEELETLGVLPPGSPSSEQLVSEDRGDY